VGTAAAVRRAQLDHGASLRAKNFTLANVGKIIALYGFAAAKVFHRPTMFT